MQTKLQDSTNSMDSTNRRKFLATSAKVVSLAILGSAFGISINAKDSLPQNTKEGIMQVIMESGDNKVIIELENNPTAKAFVAMLPLTLEWSDYVQKEKVTNLPKKLQAKGDSSYIPQIGDFFCYAPWGNVGIFYEKQPPNSGLVYMGKVVSGLELLKSQKQPFKAKVYITQKEK